VDSVTVIVSAVAAGAWSASHSPAAGELSGYPALRRLLTSRYAVDIAEVERRPGSVAARHRLGEGLFAADAGADNEVLEAAWRIIAWVQAQQPATGPAIGIDLDQVDTEARTTGKAAPRARDIRLRTGYPRGPGLEDVRELRATRRDRATVHERLRSSGSLQPGPEQPLKRYLTAELPERVAVEQRLSLTVQVIADPSGLRKSSLSSSFDLPPGGARVTILVRAPGLRSTGELEQDIQVYSTGDPHPVRFGFVAASVGLHTVTVQAYRGGTFLAELRMQVSAEVGGAQVDGPRREVPFGGLEAEPGEVTLQVSRREDGRYSFQLLSETIYAPELADQLAGDPSAAVNEIASELRDMAARKSAYSTPAAMQRRLRSLGAQLWLSAVPEAVRRQFRDQLDRITTFTITSDNDVLPWELLCPLEPGFDGGFLVDRFPVVRRMYGQRRAPWLPMTSAAYVIPPGSPENALTEVAAIRARLGRRVTDRGVLDQLDQLIELLEAMPSVLHFACHNTFDGSGSSLRLGGGPLRPTDLAPSILRKAMVPASPLVFFNACRTAGEVPWLTEMMGWARQFMEAGAGAFIGSLWAVRSSAARSFAEAFYDALVIGKLPLGTASLRARRAIAGEGDPTWLAYTIYGNPAARMHPGGRA
jgi:hypothetical protein